MVPLLGASHNRNALDSEKAEERSFDLTFHFAELEDVKSGERVFDIVAQEKTVIEKLDVVQEAGGMNKALIKTVSDIKGGKRIILNFKPIAANPEQRTAPILSGIEIIDHEGGM